MINILITLIPILLVYPFIISKIIDKNTIKSDEKSNKIAIFKNICLIIILSIISLLIISYLSSIYDDAIPDSTSNLCTNTGGWTYSCVGNSRIALILLPIIELVIIIYHFLSQRCVYNIFKHDNSIFKYIFMYVYMILIYLFNFIFIFYLYGLLISVYYKSYIVEILRFIVFISPTALFIISTIIYSIKNKNK